MKSALNKDIVRDIIKTKGRFLSIMLIVALGVAFFSGIKISPIIMRDTTDKYYDEYNLMDIRVLSTLGLTDKDEDAIRKIDGVEGVFPTYSMDVIAELKEQDKVLKVHALPKNKDPKNKDYINQVKLVEGRLPEKQGECVVVRPKYDHLNIKVGNEFNINSGTDDDIKDSLKANKYKVVGAVETPYYLSFEFGNSSIGSGSIEGVMMVPQNDFKMDAYTEMYVTVAGAKSQKTYYDEYENTVKKVEDKIDGISGARMDARYEEVVGDANKELDDARKEYEETKAETEKKIKDAENEIEQGKRDLENGKAELKNKKAETKRQIKNGFAELDNAEKQLEAGRAEYEKAKKEFDSQKRGAQAQINEAESKLSPLKSQADSIRGTISGLKDQLNNPNLSENEKVGINAKIGELESQKSALMSSYNSGMGEVNRMKSKLSAAENKISRSKSELDSNRKRIKNERSNLYSMQSKAETEFANAEKEIKRNEVKLKDAEAELNESKKKAKDEFGKAEKELKDAEDEIKKIEKPEWYVLNRDKLYSTAEYGGCADSIDALAAIFPVFFVLVAALVALTTMTRMVDEQRINIGTMKALGYGVGKIAEKYIVYAFTASIMGALLGLTIGYTVFPVIIYNSYGIRYTVPKVNLMFNIPIALVSIIASICVTTLAAFGACYKELIETPSILMRPKAPKIGKRILLERIPFIWDRISFIGKVTLRNIFRYKKRFLMTVIGISGCTALIVTGFGIKDSIQMIIDGQFGELFKYDVSVGFDSTEKTAEVEKLTKYIDSTSSVKSYELFNNQNGKVIVNDDEKEVTLVVPQDKSKMKNFVTLRDRRTHEPQKLSDKEVVISEKAARNLNVKVGDTVKLVNENDVSANVKISGITENYTNHYVYMTEAGYEKLYNRKPDYNRLYLNTSDMSDKEEDTFSKNLIEKTCANGVFFNSSIKDNFSDTIKSLNYVVLLMIVSAGALAFVVLYNLSNVNISERIREIATIKVLGFYDREVSSYIYRENVILTIIGTVFGLGVGTILHQFIMVTVEIESMMFGRIIHPVSYVIAAVLTIIMGMIVNLAMNKKLKGVKMVESLKSVD